MTLPIGLSITRPQYQEMVNLAEAAHPFEVCGLLGGLEGRTSKIYPVDNILKSPIAYEMDPLQQVTAMIDMEQQGMDLLAIYHSHPRGPETPSPTDVARAFYPDSLYVIISLENRAKPVARAFQILDGRIEERRLQVE